MLNDQEIPYHLRVFNTPAHSARQAAELLGCPLGAIVKSLVFQKQVSGELLLVLVSGKNMVDVQRLNKIVGKDVQPAKPKTVLAITGYPVGAVPPFGFIDTFPVIMDKDLLEYERVWSSAGAENMLIQIKATALRRLTRAEVKQVSQEWEE